MTMINLSENDALLIDAALSHLLDGGLFGLEAEPARNLRKRIAELLPKVAPVITKLRNANRIANAKPSPRRPLPVTRSKST